MNLITVRVFVLSERPSALVDVPVTIIRVEALKDSRRVFVLAQDLEGELFECYSDQLALQEQLVPGSLVLLRGIMHQDGNSPGGAVLNFKEVRILYRASRILFWLKRIRIPGRDEQSP